MKQLKKIIAYPFSILFYVLFGLVLVVFHPLQVIAFNVFGYKAHKLVVDLLNWCMVKILYVLFCRPTFHGFKDLPDNKPLIILANHQSLFDISPVVVGFNKHHPKFISKKELGKNIPSISYNLNKGGSVLIDRKNSSQSIKEIIKLGRKMETQNFSACLFPEGTRSRNGQMKKFQPAGIKTLLKASPNALIVPFVIDGNYKLLKYGNFPLNLGIHLKYIALEPISRENYSDEELIALVETRIKETLNQKS